MMSPERAISFGSFRLLPAQQLLLEGEVPVRLGSRALEILTVLVEHAGELVSNFDGRFVTFAFGELDTLVPAYAVTIHKSQGSEYPAVVIPILTQHYAMLQRNLLYTAVTRGKRLVVVVGQKKAVAIAVKNISGRRRWSKLNEWLAVTPSPAMYAAENVNLP